MGIALVDAMTNPISFQEKAEAMRGLLEKYDRPAPRYTSYPPAPYFVPYDSPSRYLGLIEDSNGRGPGNVSLYFHLPFCPHRCLFCGCHTEIGSPGSLVREYMRALRKETASLLRRIDPRRPVTQIHFGGGTPNAVPLTELHSLMDTVRLALNVEADAEIAIECDPALLTEDKVRALRDLGFNRISMGVQDFDRRVLDAVERRAPRMPIADLIFLARSLGFRGLNLDLIYGLPHQTEATFQATLERTLLADPDRVSVFAYAHVPWIKGHQNALDGLPKPDAAERLAMAIMARGFFIEAGYVAIGMDHFVKPDDDLALALTGNNLHRNFQGYCSRLQTGQVYAFGASAISQLEGGYGQNLKDIHRYIGTVDLEELPLERVYYMAPEDILAREAINSLMCYGRVDLLEAASRADAGPDAAAKYNTECAKRIAPLLGEGWVERDGFEYTLKGNGWLFVRQLAAALDPRMGTPENEPRFSKAI